MVNEIYLVENINNEAMTDSRKVAEYFGKQHKHVLSSIDQLIEKIKGVKLRPSQMMFKETTYINEQNHQPFRMYEMNKNGFLLLTVGFTGARALNLKLNYIDIFDIVDKRIEKERKDNSTVKKLMMEIALETSDEALKEELLHEAGERLLNGE